MESHLPTVASARRPHLLLADTKKADLAACLLLKSICAGLELLAGGVGAAEEDFHAHFLGQFGFGVEAVVGLLGAGGVGDVDVVGLVACHHLIAAHSVSHGVHDRPLWGGLVQTALCFFFRKRDDLGAAEVHLELAVFHEDTAPDDFTRLGDPVQGAATLREIHRGLTVTVAAFPSIDMVLDRSGTTDEEDPDILVCCAGLVPIAPTQVVQGGFGWLLECGVHALGHEGVDTTALVHFVEVWVGLAFEDDLAGCVLDRRTVCAVEHTFDEVGSGAEVLEALLILNAEGIATEGVTNAAGSNIHFALLDHLRLGQLGLGVLTEVEVEALIFDEFEDFFGFGLAHILHFSEECGLAELLLVDTGLEEELIRNRGVIHAHAELIENTHDRLVAVEIGCDLVGNLLEASSGLLAGVFLNVCSGVLDLTGLDPLLQILLEGAVFTEVLTPEGGVFHASLGQRAVQVQHTNEARPSAAPVGDGEDRTLVGDQTVQQVVRILPNGFRDDDRGFAIDFRKDIHALALAGDEAVLELGVVFVGSLQFAAKCVNDRSQFFFHFVLFFPAALVGAETEVTIGDEEYVFFLRHKFVWFRFEMRDT